MYTYDVLTLQKSGGARAHLGGAKAPSPPLNAVVSHMHATQHVICRSESVKLCKETLRKYRDPQ